MITRRQAIKTTAIAAVSIAIPTIATTKEPDSLSWKFKGTGHPLSDDPVVMAKWEEEIAANPQPNMISFTRTFKGNKHVAGIMVNLNDCSIETIDWQTCNIKYSNQVEIVVHLDINEYEKFKNYVYKFQFEGDREGFYSYGLYGFNWKAWKK